MYHITKRMYSMYHITKRVYSMYHITKTSVLNVSDHENESTSALNLRCNIVCSTGTRMSVQHRRVQIQSRLFSCQALPDNITKMLETRSRSVCLWLIKACNNDCKSLQIVQFELMKLMKLMNYDFSRDFYQPISLAQGDFSERVRIEDLTH